MSTRFGKVSRDKNPVAFWFVAAINGVIVLAVFLMAFGVLTK
jgi:lipid-A-disaccharide synthase-like uncharacterized protein